MEEVTKRYAVVTGANKGIVFEICKQLASNGVKVNNAGIGRVSVDDPDTLAASVKSHGGIGDGGLSLKWNELIAQTYRSSEKCLQTNYYGAKRMCEALIPLLQLSDSARIVNISSVIGTLKNITNKWAKGVLSDVDNDTEENLDELLKEFLKDFKEGSLEARGWPTCVSAYILSKATMNAYSRNLAKKYPSFYINCVCPGKTDINFNNEGAENTVRLALLPNGGPSSLFFSRKEESCF
ncbi:hypothetical protein ACOSQ2_001050 [Xanthoceras sorbifolium]